MACLECLRDGLIASGLNAIIFEVSISGDLSMAILGDVVEFGDLGDLGLNNQHIRIVVIDAW